MAANRWPWEPTWDCDEDGCECLPRVECGCGKDAYHGVCDAHLEENGWVRPGEGECWTHPDHSAIVRRNNWGEEASYMLHRLLSVRELEDGDLPWTAYVGGETRYLEISTGRNGFPVALVRWTCCGSKKGTAETDRLIEQLAGFERNYGFSGTKDTWRNTLFEIFPEFVSVKSADTE